VRLAAWEHVAAAGSAQRVRPLAVSGRWARAGEGANPFGIARLQVLRSDQAPRENPPGSASRWPGAAQRHHYHMCGRSHFAPNFL
jgi:hypothetical protein